MTQANVMSMFKDILPSTKEPTEQDTRIQQLAKDKLETLLDQHLLEVDPNLVAVLNQISQGY